MDTLFLIICYVLVIGSWSLLWSIYTGDPLYIWHRQIKFVKRYTIIFMKIGKITNKSGVDSSARIAYS